MVWLNSFIFIFMWNVIVSTFSCERDQFCILFVKREKVKYFYVTEFYKGV